MNWIIKFNELEKESIDKILDIIAKFDEYKNDLLDSVYTMEYKSKYIINNIIEKLNENNITQEYFDTEMKKINEISNEINKEYKEIFSKINKYVQDCCREIGEIKSSMTDEASEFLRSSKDAILMKRRISLFFKKITNIVLVFNMGNLDEMEIVHENCEDLIMIQEIGERKNKEYDDRQYKLMQKLKESQKKDYMKIFDYKEMVSLAEKNEYTKVRQTGDHIIMQHIKTNKIVPIPAHELKYGLMLQIQKQIHTNKVS